MDDVTDGALACALDLVFELVRVERSESLPARALGLVDAEVGELGGRDQSSRLQL
jgi:hypothetical protein